MTSNEAVRRRLIPPYLVITEKGERAVYYPKATRRRLGAAAARNLPIARGYRTISWMTRDSVACAFLVDNRCATHDLGDEPALSACKEFLSPGFAAEALGKRRSEPPSR